MRIATLAAAAVLAVLPSCYQFEVTAQAGYAQLALDGEIGYETTGAAIAQDIEGAFGLGDDQGTPYGRLMIDTGVPVLAVSGFLFEDEGTGTLTQEFGDLTIGTAVRSEFDMTNAKGSYAFKIDLGPVAISPGIAVDYFDLDIQVSDAFGAISEDVQVAGPVPMGFLRAQVDVWKIGLVAEAGYMEVDVEDVTAKFLDIEALVEIRPTDLINVFVGYRHLDLQLDGTIDNDSFDADVTLSGLFVGGGLRF